LSPPQLWTLAVAVQSIGFFFLPPIALALNSPFPDPDYSFTFEWHFCPPFDALYQSTPVSVSEFTEKSIAVLCPRPLLFLAFIAPPRFDACMWSFFLVFFLPQRLALLSERCFQKVFLSKLPFFIDGPLGFAYVPVPNRFFYSILRRTRYCSSLYLSLLCHTSPHDPLVC